MNKHESNLGLHLTNVQIQEFALSIIKTSLVHLICQLNFLNYHALQSIETSWTGSHLVVGHYNQEAYSLGINDGPSQDILMRMPQQ